MCWTLQSEFKKFNLIFNIFELSIGILNNRNSWIEQIFRLAQQFMIKRWKRGRGIIPRTNISLSKYESALKSGALNKNSAKICDFYSISSCCLMIVRRRKRNTEHSSWICCMRWLLAWPHNSKGNSECFVGFFLPVPRRIGIKLMHLFICGRSARAADRGLILFEAQQMQPYRER